MELRVAARWLKQARGLGVGQTQTKGSVRVHRYSNSLKVWDLTNAGRRGKKVRVMTLMTTYSYKGDEDKWMQNMSSEALDYGSYDRFKAFVSDLMVDYPDDIRMEERQERGIDVMPADIKEIELKWEVGADKLRLTASPLEFRVVSSHWFAPGEGHLEKRPDVAGFSQDTMYYNTKKADAAKFYAWLSGNESKVKKMTIQDLQTQWRRLGVNYDYH